MLIEQSAYTNRWRQVSPAAKGIFALCGIVAAFAAATPVAACSIAVVLCIVTVLGAGIPPGRYLRVATPALLFWPSVHCHLWFRSSLAAQQAVSLCLWHGRNCPAPLRYAAVHWGD